MKIIVFFLALLLSNAQNIGLPEEMVRIAKSQLGKPYQGNTLDIGEVESLVIRDDVFDCVTLVEHVFSTALAHFYYTPEAKDSFLLKLRYRNGEISGYESRLHYFTEWLLQAEKNGYGRNVSKELGGVIRDKKINFMSEHAALYPSIMTEAQMDIISQIEKNVSAQKVYFIPKKDIGKVEKNLKGGDILAFTTKTKGLDVFHTGIAVETNGNIHLLHASSKAQKVVISDESLQNWMENQKNCDGVVVFRAGSSF